MSRKILVTSALPYANGSIHLGHLVEYIQTDIWVRFQKMQGNECHYVCADDTHGTPIMLRAEKEGITPEGLIAGVLVEHLKDFSAFHVGFDHYYSTHSEETRQLAEGIYLKLKEAKLIEKRSIEQYYDPVKNMFLPDRFIKGECPKCGAKDQYGDNCEVVRRGLRAHRPDRTLFRRVRREAGAARLRPLFLQALRPALPGIPAPVDHAAARCRPKPPTRCRNGWARKARTSSPTGTSRATRPISASRSPMHRASISTCGWTRR